MCSKCQGIQKIVDMYGYFAIYLMSFGDPHKIETVRKLRNDLKKRFKFLDSKAIYYFLMDLEYEVIKPEESICRIFLRLGFINSKKDLDNVVEVSKQIASITGHTIRYVGAILLTYGQLGDLGICLEENPKCERCGVVEFCNYSDKNKTSEFPLKLCT